MVGAVTKAGAKFAEDIRGTVIPAVPVPFAADGTLDEELHDRYAAWMAGQHIGGIAVWAHTGRGMKLDPEQRDRVLRDWRAAVVGKPIVCGVGVPESETLPTSPGLRTEAALRCAAAVATQALRGGAEAVLVHPPKALADLPDAADRIVEYHEAICAVGLPVIAFFLYEAAGGVSYSPELIERLLALDGVVGIKLATLDSVMTYQDVLATVGRVPGALVITGEDRFLGYSLAAGASAALIGLGAAVTDCSVRLLQAKQSGQWDVFYQLTSAVDAFAQATFVVPMEGYVQRMLWALEADGVFSREAFDPWSPALAPEERDRVFAAVRQLRSR